VDLGFAVVMWAVMMVGMMLPAASPVIGLVAAANARRRARDGVAAPTALFGLGYLAVWGGFSVAAALAQWGLHAAALLSPALATSSPRVGGGLLIAAGVWQLTPLKQACLARCRNPLAWLMTEWRDGAGGALAMGVRHGAYCLGCCGLLMGLLFVAGVMNLLWVAAITAFVLVEKVASGGVWVGRAAGVLLIGAGAVLAASGGGR
jgi:predicted metal-binding membrane protein